MWMSSTTSHPQGRKKGGLRPPSGACFIRMVNAVTPLEGRGGEAKNGQHQCPLPLLWGKRGREGENGPVLQFEFPSRRKKSVQGFSSYILESQKEEKGRPDRGFGGSQRRGRRREHFREKKEREKGSP